MMEHCGDGIHLIREKKMKNDKTRKKNYIVIGTIMLILAFSVKADVSFNEDTFLRTENIRFGFINRMDFEYVSVRYDSVVFNTTGFYIDAPNDINITMEYLNASIAGANIGDTLLQFDANTTIGNVYFNISGFASGSNYTVLQNFTTYGNYTANSTGFISFNISDWSTTNYTITVVLNAFIIRIFNPQPSDGDLDVKVYEYGVRTCIDINYTNFGVSEVTLDFTSNSSGVWLSYGVVNATENGTFCFINGNFSERCDVTYYWNITATDGNITVTDSYKFTTACKLIKNIEPYDVSLLVYTPLGIIPLFFYKRKKHEKRRRII